MSSRPCATPARRQPARQPGETPQRQRRPGHIGRQIGQPGLPQWTEADRPIENTDLVCWYTVGVTHFVRPEDWPVMPVARAGFRLEPAGFFDRNPALDVPPSAAACCHREG